MCWVSLFFFFHFHLLTTSKIRECSPICSRGGDRVKRIMTCPIFEVVHEGDICHNVLDVTLWIGSYEVRDFDYLLFAFGSFHCTFNLLQWRFLVCQKVIIILTHSRNNRTMVNCSCPCIHTLHMSRKPPTKYLSNWVSPNPRPPLKIALLPCHDRFLGNDLL